MKYQSLAVAGALLLSTVVAAPAPNPRPAPEDHELWRRQYPVLECSALTGGLHVIAGGGANTPDEKAYGLLGSLATSILQAIPGSTNVSLPYNKVFATLSPATLMPGAIAGGMSTLLSYINNYHYSCPNTKIALIGYSSGAIIILNDLCAAGGPTQINQDLAGSTIIGTIAYGEETRVVGASYNAGTCTTGQGTAPRANPGACAPFSDNMQSYCDVNDPDCCVGTGDDLQVHYSYPATYDAIATQYIVDRFNAAKKA